MRARRATITTAALVASLALVSRARGDTAAPEGGSAPAAFELVDGGTSDVDPIEAPKVAAEAPTAPLAPPPPPVAAPSARPPGPSPDEPEEERPKRRFTIAVGPTLYASLPSSGGAPRILRPGVVVDGALVLPLAERVGLGLRVAWGLTEFRRFEDFTRAGYRVGKWTTTAYGDVWEWATVNDDAAAFRLVGGMAASLLLIFPYLVAVGLYALAPASPTTYLETDVTAVLHLAPDTREGTVPYLKPGLALAAVLDPRTNRLVGGAGPTLGLGMRSGHLDVSLKGTWLPPYLHGEGGQGRSHVVITGLTLGYAL